MNDETFLGEQEIELDKLDLSCQTRAMIRPQAVEEYAVMIDRGVKFERACVVFDGVNYFLSAGFHRFEAYRKLGRKAMPCLIVRGTRMDAITAGIVDNNGHIGERLSFADRRRSVEVVLQEQWEMSDRAIAELCGVSHPFVGKVRKEVSSTGNGLQLNESRVGRDGRTRALPDKSGKAEPDNEFCPCGDRWMSDGEGGRFCPKCGAEFPGAVDHTDNAPPDASGVMVNITSTGASVATDAETFEPFSKSLPKEELSKRFSDLVRSIGLVKKACDDVASYAPGPWYGKTIDALSVSADRVRDWRDTELALL